MRIVFIGTVIFSELMLEKLIELKANVVGVLTKEESIINADFRDLSKSVLVKNIECGYFRNINQLETKAWIERRRPDVIFCFGLSQIIGKEILEIAPMGVVGYHPALLPENRGRHPLIWAIVLGLEQTGSTFFFMDEGADTGDLLSQEVVVISEGMNSQNLYDQITISSINQIEKFLPELQRGTYTKVAQDHTKANSWRKRSKNDGLLDFRMSASKIRQLILALSKPHNGAHLVYNGNDVNVWESKEIKSFRVNDEPGKVLKSDRESIIIKCGENAIELLNHEFRSLPEIGEYL